MLVEEVFGWAKEVGGLHRTRFEGRAKTELAGLMVFAAYNLLKVGKTTAA